MAGTKFVATEGEAFEVEWVSREFGKSGIRTTALSVDGATGQAQRNGSPILAGAPFLSLLLAGHNGAGDITATGVKVGDVIVAAIDLTTPANVLSSFTTTVTVADKIHQTSASDLSAKNILFLLVHQS